MFEKRREMTNISTHACTAYTQSRASFFLLLFLFPRRTEKVSIGKYKLDIGILRPKAAPSEDAPTLGRHQTQHRQLQGAHSYILRIQYVSVVLEHTGTPSTPHRDPRYYE